MIALSTLYKRPNPISASQVTAPTRVLIVDDDRETTELLKIVLEPNSFDVTTVNCGAEAVDLARTFGADVMVVDLLMPEMDGMAVCRAIRAFSNLPIVVLSAYDKPGMAEQVLASGADDYLVKPMNTMLLVASLHRLARRGRAEQLGSNGGNGNHMH